MKKISLLFMIVLLSFIGCEKIDKDCPECIFNKTKEFSKNIICNHGASVSEWSFNGENVYLFSEGTCGADFGSSVYNQDCEVIGYLGGIGGNTKIKDVEFYPNASRLKYIWKQD